MRTILASLALKAFWGFPKYLLSIIFIAHEIPSIRVLAFPRRSHVVVRKIPCPELNLLVVHSVFVLASLLDYEDVGRAIKFKREAVARVVCQLQDYWCVLSACFVRRYRGVERSRVAGDDGDIMLHNVAIWIRCEQFGISICLQYSNLSLIKSTRPIPVPDSSRAKRSSAAD